MKVVFLTSDSLRHKFIAAEISKHFDLELIVTESKSAKIQDTTAVDTKKKEFIAKHFEARTKSEIYYFGEHKEFPETIQQLKLPHGQINSEMAENLISQLAPNFIILFGTSIIKEPLLKKYSGRIINLHLGLSPYYKGSATNLFPYFYKEPECVGATIHLATAKVDDGAILHQFRPDVAAGDDLHSIGNKTILKAGKILPEVLKAFLEKKIVPQRQSGKGRICRNNDFNSTVLRQIYSNFENGMIEEYLKEKENRDRDKPIVQV